MQSVLPYMTVLAIGDAKSLTLSRTILHEYTIVIVSEALSFVKEKRVAEKELIV
jgi:hypothetical protein